MLVGKQRAVVQTGQPGERGENRFWSSGLVDSAATLLVIIARSLAL